ncbi:MAG TPA: monovalent cation/H+ antiporter complex subunit F [Acidimicrobiia bacterium]|nr:monovalent cation/H+ antiporter complex subunit F [Acidimicrobiia bacterium]
MAIIAVTCVAMLAAGAAMAMIRVEGGPSILDRLVALDIITNILIIGLAVEAALNRRTETVPVLVALALVGFVGSVAVARFASVEPEDAARIKTRAEVEAEDAAQLEAELAAALLEAETSAGRDEASGGGEDA